MLLRSINVVKNFYANCNGKFYYNIPVCCDLLHFLFYALCTRRKKLLYIDCAEKKKKFFCILFSIPTAGHNLQGYRLKLFETLGGPRNPAFNAATAFKLLP